MDEIDRQICDILQKNGRIASSEIAKKLGLSVSTVNDRVRRLSDSGVVRSFRAVLDPDAFEAGFCCFVFIDLRYEGEQAAIDVLTDRPEVLELHHISGPHSYLAKVRCANAGAMQRFLRDVVKPLDAVRRTETMFSLHIEKESTDILTSADP